MRPFARRHSPSGQPFPARGPYNQAYHFTRLKVPATEGAVTLQDRLLPVRILKLAREKQGVLTVAQVAMELNAPLDQAQARLDECVRAGNALPDFDIAREHALYRFPEFTTPDRNLLSN